MKEKMKLQHIYKRFGDVEAVKDFNLTVYEQDFLVLVGPSGCGKSTTLRMIAGLEDITEGDFYIDGYLMNDVASKDRDIAMVFQNYALYPHMTVFDNMAFGLKLRKVHKQAIKERVHEAAKILGLESYLDRKPKALSGGQRQRVALGRAIVRDANIFLMDEPLSNLDAKLRVQMRAEISKLHQELKTTTIYVTHDQTEAMTMATRLVVMKDGVIQQIGTPKEVYEQPVNMFVGGFLGSPAMNFFQGVCVENGFLIEDYLFQLPPSLTQQLKERGYVHQEIVMGIRPEHIHREKASEYASVHNATVTISELTGSEVLIHAKLGEQDYIAKLQAHHLASPNEQIELFFDLSKALFFNRDTEERII